MSDQQPCKECAHVVGKTLPCVRCVQNNNPIAMHNWTPKPAPSADEVKCRTCANLKDNGCTLYTAMQCGTDTHLHWTPKPPAPQPEPREAAEPVTVATFDAVLSNFEYSYPTMSQGPAGDFLRSLRPLVVAADAQRRIEAAGCQWCHEQVYGPQVRGPQEVVYIRCPDWPAAAAWAEEQAAAREAERVAELWSARVCDMTKGQVDEMLFSLGVTRPSHLMMWFNHAVGVAQGMSRYDASTDRIWLGPLPMPGTEVGDGD